MSISNVLGLRAVLNVTFTFEFFDLLCCNNKGGSLSEGLWLKCTDVRVDISN